MVVLEKRETCPPFQNRKVISLSSSPHPSYYSFIHSVYSFIQVVLCLATCPQPLPKPVLYILWRSASAFNFHYPLISIMSSNSCLPLLPSVPITSILPSIFSSITRFRRKLLRKTWPTQLAFLFCCTYGVPFLLDSDVILRHFSHSRSKIFSNLPQQLPYRSNYPDS